MDSSKEKSTNMKRAASPLDQEGEKKKRATTRLNAGRPPNRLGWQNNYTRSPAINTSSIPIDEENQQQNIITPLSVSGRSHTSRKSSRASKSSSSTIIRQSQIDIISQDEIDLLEEQYDDYERAVERMEFAVKATLDRIEKLKDELALVDGLSEEPAAELKLKIVSEESLLKQQQRQVEIQKSDLKFAKKNLTRKVAQIQRKAAHNKQIVEAEETEDEDRLSQQLSDEEDTGLEHPDLQAERLNLIDQLDQQQRTDIEQQTLMERQRIAQDIVNLQQTAAATIVSSKCNEYEDELLGRLRRLRNEYPPLSNAAELLRHKNDSPALVTGPMTSQSSDTLSTQFAQVMSQAFEKLGNNSNNTDKFLARQVQGRDLPVFSGRPEEWSIFITAYENSTSGCCYTNMDNLPRLQKAIKGEALKTIQCLLARPENVPSIISKLRMRFGRPEHIIQMLINKTKEVPTFKEDRLDLFIEFGLSVDNLVETIKSLNCLEHLTSPQLLEEFASKLPVSLRTKWIEWVTCHPQRKENLQLFAEWLTIQTEIACKICPPKYSLLKDDSSSKKPWEERKLRRKEEKVWAVTSANEESKQPNQRNHGCLFCDGKSHQLVQCRQFEKENTDDRWKFVKSKRLCFGCLKYGHSSKDCSNKKECKRNGCLRPHHPLLHKDKTPAESKDPEKTEITKQTMGHATGTNLNVHNLNTRINLMILPVVLSGPKGLKNTFAMLDPGATVTVIDQEVADELGLEGERQPFIHSGLHPTMEEKESRSVSLEILNANGDKRFSLNNVRTKSHLCLPNQSVKRKLLKGWNHLKHLPIQCYEQGTPTILIGLDNHRLSNTRELRLGPGNSPAAGRTELGWVLLGNVNEVNREQFCGMIFEKTDDQLHQLVKHHFTTEAFGVKLISTKPRSKEDLLAQEILNNSVRRVGDCWESGLLWKSEDVQLPNTKQMAMSRLLQMERRMDKDPEFAKQYITKIEEYIRKGFARVLSKTEAKVETPRTFYLPHFMNRNPKKPKKLRFVFDAAAKVNGVSLNDKLLKGPDKLTSLPGILLKFRQQSIGITADIKDMFHRVKVRAEDACAQRFLWRGMDRTRDPDVLEMGVLIFGAACSPACAQEAKNLNALNFSEQYPEGAKAIIDRHYVDDYLDSVSTVEKAVQMFREVREIHMKGGFDICNWISNSRELLAQIPTDLHAPGVKNMDLDGEAERVLGLFWKPDSDHFTFSMTFLKTTKEVTDLGRLPTKRELLSLVMSLYDPLGFLSILTIKAKILLQETWRMGIGWDDEIPRTLHEKWERWIEELKTINTFNLPRCYSSKFMAAIDIQLHVFCDASEQAFGGVGYFRIKTEDSIAVTLVMSKAKVAPTKQLTMPRLELQAAVLGTRLGTFIKMEHEVKINKTVYWSDSSTVLKWIRSEGNQFKQFVACRVGEILEASEVPEWRWIPTKLNVADELTRDNKSCDWSNISTWVNGPEFIKKEEEEWPTEPVSRKRILEEDPEMKKEYVCLVTNRQPLLDINRFSSYSRATRSMGYVLRFIQNCRFPVEKPLMLELSPVEVEKAEQWWWRWSQEDSFGSEINAMRNKQAFPNNRRLLDVNAVLDEDEILRIHGRLENALVPIYTKRPVVLHPQNRYTQLLILDYHQRNGHHGKERVTNELRQRFYIPNLRSAVSKVWRECQKCKIEKAQPISPQMGQLPAVRLESFIYPFKNTGLDYFGPLTVTIGRRHEKRWVALFTCLSTRAVHVEMTSSLSTDSCIMAIRRFIARRGNPGQIYSDNGTNFVGTKNELQKALKELNQQQITAECTSRGILWHFIPPHAPHMGGSWERMVKSIKVALNYVLKDRSPKEEVLQTLLVEAEHIVNGHPLTHVPVDPDDFEALTPNHWLIGRSSNDQAPGHFVDADLCLRKQWRHAQQLVNHFWKRWVHEYLPVLLRRTKWFQQTKPIQIGDLVIVVDNQLTRNSWPRGIVTKLYPGTDGITRVVDVKSPSGIQHRRIVAKLCILDVQSAATPEESVPNIQEDDGSKEDSVSMLAQQ